MPRKLRTSEVIHRFDESLSFYNRKHNTSYTFIITSADQLDIMSAVGEVIAKLEFEAVFNAMHMGLRSRNKFVREAIAP